MNPAFVRDLKRFLLAVALAAPLLAQAAAGEFAFVVGEVTVTRASGAVVVPAKGTPVEPGDRIATGANGMAQLTMVDKARLSLRPNTQFMVEQYPQSPNSADGAILRLFRGTLRTFTGLIAATNRDKFVMKTRVATVGIRGSGNILYACEGADCDPGIAAEGENAGPITVNHTIEGSHTVTNVNQPGAPEHALQTLITGPGQTVMVAGGQAPRFIPTPAFISNVATNMTNAKAVAGEKSAAAGDLHSYAPSDSSSLPPAQTSNTPLVGNNGLGFPTIDASDNLAVDPAHLQDIVIGFVGSSLAGQAQSSDVDNTGGSFHGYLPYAPTQGGITPAIGGGTLQDFATIGVGNGQITLGRYENADLGFSGPGSTSSLPGSIHFITGPSGFPGYLADVLTGTASYALAGATSPTNQNNVLGSLGSATLNVDFTHRTLGLNLGVSLPGATGGSWQMAASDVPFSLNRFFGSTSDHLVITNATGQSSAGNSALTGSFDGSFVGAGLSGAILGYGISDSTSSNSGNWNTVSGVAGFTGPTQDGLAPYREGRVSDAGGALRDFIASYSTTDRPDEVVSDTQGRATAFNAPLQGLGSHASYSIGTAQVVESGADPQTGLIWGRWSGGVAQATNGTQTSSIFLENASLHYIYAGTQSGPVALPLTGSAVYDVIGNTSPTDSGGHVGSLNTATLNANFTNRTVDAAVNLAINGQTWTGTANGMPIYRDQYFSAYAGTPIPGVLNPAPLVIGCTPGCGVNAFGSFDGFFTGRTGERAGLMYNLGGNQGVVAFGRRGP